MKPLYILTVCCLLFCLSAQAQSINFASEYDKLVWPTNLGVSGGITGDDNSYKRLTLYHGHSISLQTGSNQPGISQSRLYIDATGKVGIGTTAPDALATLHVNGADVLSSGPTNGFRFRDRKAVPQANPVLDDWIWYATDNVARFHRGGVGDILAVSSHGNLSVGDAVNSSTPTRENWFEATTLRLNASDYTTIAFHDAGNRVDFIRAGDGVIQLGYDGGFGPANIGLPNGVWNSVGNVGIGTTNPGAYKLAVEGKIGAREVEVKVGSWADFVFQPGYSLRPLSEVAAYVSTHQHLPEIPSEAEVKANGIGLGEMNAKLLQKIEELTLYMIEQQKELTKLKQEVRELRVNK